jgi:hypothetical protein
MEMNGVVLMQENSHKRIFCTENPVDFLVSLKICCEKKVPDRLYFLKWS